MGELRAHLEWLCRVNSVTTWPELVRALLDARLAGAPLVARALGAPAAIVIAKVQRARTAFLIPLEDIELVARLLVKNVAVLRTLGDGVAHVDEIDRPHATAASSAQVHDEGKLLAQEMKPRVFGKHPRYHLNVAARVVGILSQVGTVVSCEGVALPMGHVRDAVTPTLPEPADGRTGLPVHDERQQFRHGAEGSRPTKRTEGSRPTKLT